VSPVCDLLHQVLRDEFLLEEKSEDLPGENLSEEAVRESGEVMEAALAIVAPFCRQEVDMGVNWRAEQLEMVAKARRVIGYGGAFPPYEGIKKKFFDAKSFEEAFELRPFSQSVK
jgi:hypothetical protein